MQENTIEHFEERFKQGDFLIYLQGWIPASPKAMVHIVHGFGEHSGRYTELAHFLALHGYAVIAHDQVGNGKSEGTRGNIPSYSFLLETIELIIKQIEEKFPQLPYFLMGHSMGANLVANLLLQKESKALSIAGAILSAPFFLQGENADRYNFLTANIRWLIHFVPNFSMKGDIPIELLTRDPEETKKYSLDPLNHNRMYAKLFLPMLDNGKYAIEHAHEITIPLLLMHGTSDKLARPEGAKQFANNANPKLVQVKFWENSFHEIHHEIQETRILVFDEILNWLERQSELNEHSDFQAIQTQQ